MSRRRAASRVAALTAGLVLVAGCGNRVDHDDVVAVGNGYGPVSVPAGQSAATDLGVVSPVDGAPPAASVAGAGAAPRASGPGTKGPAAVGAADRSAAAARPASAAAAVPAAGSTARAACPRPLAPIVLGQTLATSGLVGATVQAMRTGLAVWAQAVNAAGGVQCHPVQLIQLDDASDPARVSANWNTMVRDRGAVAVLGAAVPIAISALRSAAERDKVPVIGGDMGSEDWFASPYLFPTGASPLSSYDGAVLEAAKAGSGPAKAGLFYCVESTICTSVKNNYPTSAERAGAALGPSQAVSLTQPDYTSECQTMKSDGVNVIFIAADGSAAVRMGRSCASLNYHPVFAGGSLAMSALAAADAGLRRNKVFLGTGMAPYMTTDPPGARAFHAAMKAYAPTAGEEQNALLGWAAGAMFEAAMAKVSDRARAEEVSTALILDGLWQVKNEKLGGLSPGSTFAKGGPAKQIDCYYGIRLDTSGFSAPSGSKVNCFSSNGSAAETRSDYTSERGLARTDDG